MAWVVGSAAPQRVRSLVALSTPHVSAFGRALAEAGGEQARASSYFAAFRAEGSERRFLENDAAQFKELLGGWGGMSEADVETYLAILGTEEALGAALNWYRAGTGGGTAATPPPPAIVTVSSVRLPELATTRMRKSGVPAWVLRTMLEPFPSRVMSLTTIGRPVGSSAALSTAVRK